MIFEYYYNYDNSVTGVFRLDSSSEPISDEQDEDAAWDNLHLNPYFNGNTKGSYFVSNIHFVVKFKLDQMIQTPVTRLHVTVN